MCGSFIEAVHFATHCDDIVAFSTMRDLGAAANCDYDNGGGSDTYARFNVCNYTGDAPGHVVECRGELCAALGIAADHLIMPRQTHSSRVAIIDSEFMALDDASRSERLQGIDALVTTLCGVAVGVNTADCVPLLLRDVATGAIGVAHAGWKGTVARIAARTVEAMQQLGAEPSRIEVAIGPSICPQCFEVGDEVVEQFAAAGFPIDAIVHRDAVTGKAHINLWEANAAALIEAGVQRRQLTLTHRCTRCNPGRYFSARRLGIASGRIFTTILRRR
ncbi:MAG: peptidoglycan editing factor PgeF [Bacteroidales bacterium]|nr:peptidoglycan editing factor PgeF [Bacteroidales bacterium]